MLVVVLIATAVIAILFQNGSGEAMRSVAEVRHPEQIVAPPTSRKMIASYYGPGLQGNRTASGEPFDPQEYTAAHNSLPLGTELRVSYGGKSVRVTVNDRGPYAPGYDLDLSLAAARKIGLIEPGTAPVRVVVQ